VGAVAILLLAAGASRRMRGADKLMEKVEGQPLLRRQARAALATGAEVIVALPPGSAPRAAALEGLPVQLVEVAEAAEGMGRSLAAAAAAAPAGADLLVVLADMPEIGALELAVVMASRHASPGAILRGAAADGRPGHPVLIPARLRPQLADLAGDAGARALMTGEDVIAIPLPGSAALTDLDTPEAWAAWRAARGDG
jgi:CTP:molybdopterin cytidylyltransferase MocA